MIVIDGPDGVGKTTFCKRLLERLPTHIYAHFTRLPAGFDFYWGYVGRMSHHVVQDRFHMSELAYARARGENPRLSREGYRLIDARLRQLGGYTVLIVATQELIQWRWDASQMYDLATTLRAVRQFDLILESSGELGVDIDAWCRCGEKGRDYPDDDFLDRVVAEYQERQRLVDVIAARRPPSLQA